MSPVSVYLSMLGDGQDLGSLGVLSARVFFCANGTFTHSIHTCTAACVCILPYVYLFFLACPWPWRLWGSCTGVYVPTLAQRVVQGNTQGQSDIKLKGILVGNGCTGSEVRPVVPRHLSCSWGGGRFVPSLPVAVLTLCPCPFPSPPPFPPPLQVGICGTNGMAIEKVFLAGHSLMSLEVRVGAWRLARW